MSTVDQVIETAEFKALLRLKPLFDKIAVVRLPEKEVSAGGIVIADMAKEKTCRGVIVTYGDDCKYTGNKADAGHFMGHGDEIVFGVYAGVPLPDIGPLALILREEEILAKQQPESRPNLVPQAPAA